MAICLFDNKSVLFQVIAFCLFGKQILTKMSDVTWTDHIIMSPNHYGVNIANINSLQGL